jgi:Ca2+-binding EF-hand superfamily protein
MKLVITTIAALAIAGTFAIAEDAKPAAPADKGDKPKNEPSELFKKIDSNNDNSISLEEFKAGPAGKKDPAKAEEIFKRRDKDGDGKLSPEEFAARGGKKKDAK